MAILLRQLCEKASYLYGMRILAGENGTGNIVQWIHTLEDVETGGFIHGGELIFTTGIAQEGNEWLLEFVENLYEREASGLVVNVGPYITSVPQAVIDYCNQMNFPLLEVPWKTRSGGHYERLFQPDLPERKRGGKSGRYAEKYCV